MECEDYIMSRVKSLEINVLWNRDFIDPLYRPVRKGFCDLLDQ